MTPEKITSHAARTDSASKAEVAPVRPPDWLRAARAGFASEAPSEMFWLPEGKGGAA
ncbi:MAG: hypothetical protein LBI02_04275 [Opitutaceae bacterium]|jgi:hypothetical protein|nr:hypothetical protein [Opitutaceae bacterium]